MASALLRTITELSHEFGTGDYVKGGGGNTSCKDADTVWVKPSGTTLGGLSPEAFVALDREKLDQLYAATPPDDPSGREAFVKDMMMAAVRGDSRGRPSVEAPLHNTFDETFVVHTHPTLVNGMTCGKNGEAACRDLFPDALWIGYTDPGFTLCMVVRDALLEWDAVPGDEARVVFLENHGVFVAANSPEGIREAYAGIIGKLRDAYAAAGVATHLDPSGPASVDVAALLGCLKRDSDVFVDVCGPQPVATGPVTPDHIVYSKAFPLTGELSEAAVRGYTDKHGYPPKVIATDRGIVAVGTSEKDAALTLEMARDGGLVIQLAEAFGGIRFMTDRAYLFIENWEVESYRRKVSG